ncbi:hypothetical protein [Tropicibacter naphthalenivorans]|uniref:Uncharacterized protein n=1 Tax=Tropicibacter naphthalenivorans TaxID=441103 RepID=A0A0N7LYZ9_9RHOB|nr:hypothetical protein [Tropicibacter naphthalenivorans]CUH76273.1 hypothetical protein TRN7648_00865 [Tropicibacter naphthalenivorans]SMC39063.1 hypothetical protein SAMN04488093_10117 [Tropicibacter naphthalenivorans]
MTQGSDLLAGGLRDYTLRRIAVMRQRLREVPKDERVAITASIVRAEGVLALCRKLTIDALYGEYLARERKDGKGIRCHLTQGIGLQYSIIRWDTGRPILHIGEWNTPKGRALRQELLRQPVKSAPIQDRLGPHPEMPWRFDDPDQLRSILPILL